MKESIRAIQQDGSSKPLLELVKRRKIQRLSIKCIKTYKEHAYVTLFNHNGLYWYHEGIVEKSSSVLLELCMKRVIEASVESRRLLQVNGEKVNGIEHAQVLDLNDEGERWEGDVLNDEPYGWGMLYDSENRMVYEGFRIGDVNVCYGRRFFPDVQNVEYEGGICEGKRWGRGVQYDRNGDVIIDGEWINDDDKIENQIVLNRWIQFLHNRIEELIVDKWCCRGREWRGFDLSFMSIMRLLRIGDFCFDEVKEVRLIGLNQLESVVIGKQCFSNEVSGWVYPDRSGHFYLKNCERLRELKIGYNSFSTYRICEIENVDSLEVIEMRELNEVSRNFRAASLELRSAC